MPFLTSKIQPNGALSVAHKVLRVETSTDGLRGMATVNSYATEEMMTRDGGRLNWQDTYEIPLVHMADAEEWLISPEGAFFGASVIAEAASIQRTRDRRWQALKEQRNALESAGFLYLNKSIASDARSVQRITIACLAAQAAVSTGQPFSIEWTCVDGTVLVLDAGAMLEMSVALAAHGSELHAKARVLRTQIEAAETMEAIAAVTWTTESLERN